jgi:hypothetical protein
MRPSRCFTAGAGSSRPEQHASSWIKTAPRREVAIHQRKGSLASGSGGVCGFSVVLVLIWGLLLRLALLRRGGRLAARLRACWPPAARSWLVRRGWRVPAARVFSPYVAQAGSAGARGWAGGLPRQRSTGLVRSPGGTGEGCPGWITGWVPGDDAGSPSPLTGEEGPGHPWRVRVEDALVRRPPPAQGREHARRRRPPGPSRHRARS